MLVMALLAGALLWRAQTTGMLVLVACTLSGQVSWISDPVDGRHHDAWCLDDSGLRDADHAPELIGDKGFIGKEMITPFRKPPGGKLLDWQKEFNKQVNTIRAIVEQVIANFKTWRIMHTDYRRPIATFAEILSSHRPALLQAC